MKSTCEFQHRVRWAAISLLVLILLVPADFLLSYTAVAQSDDPSPPNEVIKLIFIHHSTGENWLSDENGGLGKALAEHNYFTSDTNYGWGPDAIGDRTDIPNWPEWFTGPERDQIMMAVYNENEVHSPYTRSLADPGGENEIILFKSCFPNSNLEGSPQDPPAPGDGYTVANAKYVYNSLLNYFSTRPDKLFIVITAPPVSDPTYAANARAFNNWLVFDWLSENGYTQNNVAVFDFYNLLTGVNNHHRFIQGSIEYTNSQGGDTAAYASSEGDDHPSQAGNLKATAEFIPMLNIFYNRWRAGTPAAPPPDATVVVLPTSEAQPPAVTPETKVAADTGVATGFEPGDPSRFLEWQGFWDESVPTTLTCQPDASAYHNGEQALHMDFNVSANSWATCVLFFDHPQDWSQAEGLSFYYQASQPGLVFDIDIYLGGSEERKTYPYSIETVMESAPGWVPVQLRWSDFARASWETDPGSPLEDASSISGLGFGFNTFPDTPNVGSVWIDDLQLTGLPGREAVEPVVETVEVVPVQAESGVQEEGQPAAPPAGEPETPVRTPGCPSVPGIAGAAIALVAWRKVQHRTH